MAANIVFNYYTFDVFRVYSDIPCFIPDISNFCLLFFFVSLARDLSILLIFSNNQLFVSLICSVAFLFSVHFLYLFSSFCLFWVCFALLSLCYEIRLLNKISPQNCVNCVPHILIHCNFIFIQFNVFLKRFPLRLHL